LGVRKEIAWGEKMEIPIRENLEPMFNPFDLNCGTNDGEVADPFHRLDDEKAS